LEAKLSGISVAERLGIARPPLPTALTVTLDTPEAMAAQAKALGKASLIKIKVDAQAPLEQIRAVRHAAPAARLIVDPNEAWSPALLVEALPELAELRVDLLEQPIPAAQSEALAAITPLVPICADEACHTTEDLPALVGRYQVVNIKLDKTGGLTEALTMLRGPQHGLWRDDGLHDRLIPVDCPRHADRRAIGLCRSGWRHADGRGSPRRHAAARWPAMACRRGVLGVRAAGDQRVLWLDPAG
jgi:hypothetical protein